VKAIESVKARPIMTSHTNPVRARAYSNNVFQVLSEGERLDRLEGSPAVRTAKSRRGTGEMSYIF